MKCDRAERAVVEAATTWEYDEAGHAIVYRQKFKDGGKGVVYCSSFQDVVGVVKMLQSLRAAAPEGKQHG